MAAKIGQVAANSPDRRWGTMREVLAELGYGKDQIAALRAEKAI